MHFKTFHWLSHHGISAISITQLVDYCKSCILIGYATRGLLLIVNNILVSKETVVLRRWEIETEIDFIKRVDKGRITTVKDLESLMACNWF